jgi:Leucine-rich repeat (LRR) protein
MVKATLDCLSELLQKKATQKLTKKKDQQEGGERGLTPQSIDPHADPKELKTLDLSCLELTEVGDLSSCLELRRLDLSQNLLEEVVKPLSCLNKLGITWVSLAYNKLGTMRGVEHLKKITGRRLIFHLISTLFANLFLHTHFLLHSSQF